MIEDDIYTALSPLVGGRVFPTGTVRQAVVYPFITYMSVGGRPVPVLCGGLQDAYNTVMQIECWAQSTPALGGMKASVNLIRAVRAVLTVAPYHAWARTEPIQLRHDATGIDGHMMDFSFWWRP